MLLADPRFGALALGTILVLAAALAPRVVGRPLRSSHRLGLRVGLALAGAALLVWGFSSILGSRSPAQPPPGAAPIPPGAPVDLVDAASLAVQDCPRGTAPAIPDGATASREQMTAAHSAFQAYDAATNSYVHCVDATIERISKQYAGVASPAELKALQAFGVGAHDTAIDQEQAIADRFNGQIRAYKAKHPQS